MKILIAPDKFKGSLTGLEVIEAIKQGIKSFDENIEIETQLLADGGEGTLEVLEQSLDVERIELSVAGPISKSTNAYYLLQGEVAYIEMAQASGLLLLPMKDRNPLYTSTFGTGQMILDAMDKGVKSINLFVGGSATNDCGLGMAKALGFQFYDANDKELEGRGEELGQVVKIDLDNVDDRIADINFKVLTDVQNPLLGDNGAAHVYGPQKGATVNIVDRLEQGAKHLVSVMSNDKENVSGAGAAGGLGYGALSFLNAEIQSGIEFLMEVTSLESKVKQVDLVITGEGSIDHQTLEGKVIAGLYELCKNLKVPMAVLCGRSNLDSFSKALIYQIMDKAKSTEDAMENAIAYLSELTQQLLSDFRA